MLCHWFQIIWGNRLLIELWQLGLESCLLCVCSWKQSSHILMVKGCQIARMPKKRLCAIIGSTGITVIFVTKNNAKKDFAAHAVYFG